MPAIQWHCNEDDCGRYGKQYAKRDSETGEASSSVPIDGFSFAYRRVKYCEFCDQPTATVEVKECELTYALAELKKLRDFKDSVDNAIDRCNKRYPVSRS